MGDESHVVPLAPSRIHHRSDDHFPAAKPADLRHRNKRINKCPVYLLFVFVFLSIAFLAFSLTVLRFRSPVVRLRPLSVTNLRYGFSPRTSLNATLTTEITLDNRNYVRFRFGENSVRFMYGNATMGTSRIHGGRVLARSTKRISVMIQLRSSDALSRNANFSGDVGANLVWLSSYAKIRGEVQAIKIIKRHRTAELNCTMALNLNTQNIQDVVCH